METIKSGVRRGDNFFFVPRVDDETTKTVEIEKRIATLPFEK